MFSKFFFHAIDVFYFQTDTILFSLLKRELLIWRDQLYREKTGSKSWEYEGKTIRIDFRKAE